ncbi:1-acyl-sn-glycerol-3-phosphate acyltransferase [Fluviicola sp.]|jgi:putative hemolysin|uniref:1-acyl-sn-glycerol-3-phosphate acyltransferase n=1 Tax=Fluviicola sp. TaxID=1917219 RepID=UPI0028295101|nr:1-acyl-sn-glycerol-3-phosphate acyltransferase [Fluviicola sp.]MDR0803101.1 1-acyl-sn-glycerol-3-phosphate acyltransferase [Fluviicola sp.]
MKQQEEFINVRRLIQGKNPRLAKWIPGFIIHYLERILHQKEINDFLKTHDTKNQDFCRDVLEAIGVTYSISGIENIPKTGKCLVVMNHPLGGMDAMALVDGLRDLRTDIKFIVNDLLLNLDPLKEIFVGVNKHGKTKNSSLLQVNNLFASDQLVCIFPAGLVSRKTKGIVRDLEWKKTFVKQARQNDQIIIPVHIEGELSSFFYRLANFRKFLGIKMNIEMLYLADEMFRQKGKHIQFTVGEPIKAKTLDTKTSDVKWAEWFRNHVYALKK